MQCEGNQGGVGCLFGAYFHSSECNKDVLCIECPMVSGFAIWQEYELTFHYHWSQFRAPCQIKHQYLLIRNVNIISFGRKGFSFPWLVAAPFLCNEKRETVCHCISVLFYFHYWAEPAVSSVRSWGARDFSISNLFDFALNIAYFSLYSSSESSASQSDFNFLLSHLNYFRLESFDLRSALLWVGNCVRLLA